MRAVANVIFLESPAGVGFSFSRNTTDYDTVGDRRTAEDAYVFMVKWLERFPEYKGRDFYIAGESYAGHYVPELAAVIVAIRKFTGKNPTNLKGIFVSPSSAINHGNYLGGKLQLQIIILQETIEQLQFYFKKKIEQLQHTSKIDLTVGIDLHPLAQRPIGPLTRALIGSAQPNARLVGPCRAVPK